MKLIVVDMMMVFISVQNIFLIGAVSILVVGTIVTGSGPLSGDVSAKRYHLDAVVVAKLHSYLGILTLLSLICLAISIKFYEKAELFNALRNWVLGAFLIFIVQGVIGYRQFALGLPEILVGLHLLGATLIWIFTWNIHLRMRKR